MPREGRPNEGYNLFSYLWKGFSDIQRNVVEQAESHTKDRTKRKDQVYDRRSKERRDKEED